MKTSVLASFRNIALLSMLSATALADPAVVLKPGTDPAMAPSLSACVRAAAGDAHTSRLEVVRYVEHAGRGSYEYWFNASSDPLQSSYCRTLRGDVSEFRSFDGHWAAGTPARPTTVARTASSDMTCAVGDRRTH